MAEWFYLDEDFGEQGGPVDAEYLGQAVASGKLDRVSCVVWKEGMDEWLPIAETPALTDVLYRHLC